MKNSLSYTLGMWIACLSAAVVWGWGADLHASISFQTFCAYALPVILGHLGITTGKRVMAGNAASAAPATPAAPVATPAPEPAAPTPTA